MLLPLILAVAAPKHADPAPALAKRKQAQVETLKKAQREPGFTFTDRTDASGITFATRVVEDAGKRYVPTHYDHGESVAAADVDGDGKPDVFFTTQLGACQLWRNKGDGTFEDITAKSGIQLVDQIAVGASFADYDNDGDADLFVTTTRHGNHLFQNQGDGTFKDVTEASGLAYSGHSQGAVWFDYDRDGKLDLYVFNVGAFTTDSKGPGGYYLSPENAFYGHLFPQRAELGRLYHNDGAGKFTDVTEATGLLDKSWKGDGSFTDINGDGYPDLYVLDMLGNNHLWVNQGGKKFADQTDATFPKTPWGAMGIKFFDADRDGALDLLVTDMHSDMMPQQTAAAEGFDLKLEKEKSTTWCSGKEFAAYFLGREKAIFGNALFMQADSKWTDKSTQMGTETWWPWGVTVADFDADGFEDIFVTAGMGYPYRYAPNSLLLSNGGKGFLDAELAVGLEPRTRPFEQPWFDVDCDGADRKHDECAGKKGKRTVNGVRSSRSSVAFDLDDDGDLDLITNEFNDRAMVFVSDRAQSKTPLHFLKVKLQGTQSNRDGLGAVVKVTVKVTAGTRALVSQHDGKGGYLAQSSLPLYFGLGDTEQAASVEVRWPSGAVQTVTDAIPKNGLLTITEPKTP
jgi:hypothetical protein